MYDLDQFSEREKEVIQLLLQARSNKQIAMALGISVHTVEYHLKNIYRKLQVSSRMEAVLKVGESVGIDRSGTLGKSVVEINEAAAENESKSFSVWRLPMRKLFPIVGGLVAIALGVTIMVISRTARTNAVLPATEIRAISTVLPTVTQNLLTRPPTDTSFSEFEYSVVSGDTCESIAATFKVSIASILERNHLSSDCPLTSGQILFLLGKNVQIVSEEAEPIPTEFYGEWKHARANPNITRVLILAHAGTTYINMFGACQPVDCDWLNFSPNPAISYRYDPLTGTLHVQWTFDFLQATQALTLTPEGTLKIVTQGHYLDDSGRTDYDTVEYFVSQ